MKKYLVIIITLISVSFTSCEDVDPPLSEFSALQLENENFISIQFSDLSSNNPDEWEWYFEGGRPTQSNERNPIVSYSEPGTYDVILTTKNEGGKNELRKDAFINIARILNYLPSIADVRIDGQTKTVEPKSNVHFLFIDKYNSYCYIETSGKTIEGEKIGLTIKWEFPINMMDYYFYGIELSPEIVFFNLTNISDYNITHFHTNCNNSDFESFEEISIPNDSKKYPLGYYYANSGMEVRAYFSEGYLYWTEGYSFYIPWTNNQSVNLIFNLPDKGLYEKCMKIPEKNSDYINNTIREPKDHVLTIYNSQVKR